MWSVQSLIDAAGRRRSPAATPGFRAGVAPRNKGQRYPADPPTVDEIVAVMRQAGHDRHGHRLTALIVVLRRAGLRIHQAQSLTETDLDQRRGSILVGHGNNDRRREVGMDACGAAHRAAVLRDRRPNRKPHPSDAASPDRQCPCRPSGVVGRGLRLPPADAAYRKRTT
jgi:site-specific recombinase XerC